MLENWRWNWPLLFIKNTLQFLRILANIGEIDNWDQFHQQFIIANNLWADFSWADFKSAKRHWQLDCLFALLGSVHVKALHKYVGEFDPCSSLRILSKYNHIIKNDIDRSLVCRPKTNELENLELKVRFRLKEATKNDLFFFLLRMGA